MTLLPVHITDGGRRSAGFRGLPTGDCVARSVAIASGRPYREVYDRLADGSAGQRRSKRTGKRGRSASDGINVKRKWFRDYMAELGFRWVSTMGIGTGCKVHLRAGEIPMAGRMVVSLSKHYTAVIDGNVFDVYDPSRGGTRCVYGYWVFEGGKHVQL